MPDMWMDVDTALSEVPVNLMPLIDDTTFKDIEDAVAYNASGMALFWHFVTTDGAYTVTAVTPTTGGTYDWTDQGTAGIYTIEIPASGGASINNDTEGFGWFTGKATGILPWRGPVIGFRAAALNNLLIDDAYSTTRGLAGTALPNAAAEAAGGLYTRGTGAGQIKQTNNGEVDSNATRVAGTTQTGGDLASFLAALTVTLDGVVLHQGLIGTTGTDTTHVQLPGFPYANDAINGLLLVLYDAGDTEQKDSRWIEDWVLTSELATVSTLTFTPDASTQYWLLSIRRDVTITTDGIAAASVSSAAANKIADHVRRRTQANVETSSDGDTISNARSAYGLTQQAQNSNTTANAGKLTVFKVDGTTELEQIDIDPDAAADPIVGIG